MTDDVLSQEEVESLLNARETPGASVQATSRAPDRLGNEQLRALQSLHEGFSRNLGASLSGMLRTMVEVKLTSVDQLTYGEFVLGLDIPTCFNLIKAEPLDGGLMLDISPSILYPIIDRLLGGGKETGSTTRRPLTEIELRLVSRITKVFLDELRRAWENIVSLELSVERVESNPQLVLVVPPNEVVIRISFALTIGEARGTLNLCIPFNSIKRFSGKLAATTCVSHGQSRPHDQSLRKGASPTDGSMVELVVTLAQTTITTSDLIGLRVGDIITTDIDTRQLLDVGVEGVSKFSASPGALKGQKAIQVREIVPMAGSSNGQ